MRLWRPILLALFLGVVGLLVGSPTTTTASGTTFTYDAPALAVVDAHASPPADAGQGTRVGVREGSASPSVGARGTATTPHLAVVATEAASPAGALEGQWAQAPNDGFLGNFRAAESLEPGTVIDRYGGETGRFFSPAGTSFEARALPAGSGPLNAYEVLKPLDVQAGIVAPAFGQPGLGIQYMAPQTVADLIEGGFIKPVAP